LSLSPTCIILFQYWCVLPAIISRPRPQLPWIQCNGCSDSPSLTRKKWVTVAKRPRTTHIDLCRITCLHVLSVADILLSNRCYSAFCISHNRCPAVRFPIISVSGIEPDSAQRTYKPYWHTILPFQIWLFQCFLYIFTLFCGIEHFTFAV